MLITHTLAMLCLLLGLGLGVVGSLLAGAYLSARPEVWPESDDEDALRYPAAPLSPRDQALFDAGWAQGYTWASLHPEPIAEALGIDLPQQESNL